MKPTRIMLGTAALLAASCATQAIADTSYFLHPPGCLWGALVSTNTPAVGLAACPGGVVVAANHVGTSGLDPDYAVLAKVSGNDGAVLLRTNFQAEGAYNRIAAIIPVTNAAGTIAGVAVTGSKFYEELDPLWGAPALWAVRLDLNLVKQAHQHVGVNGWNSEGFCMIQEPTGFAVGARRAPLGGPSQDWLLRLDAYLHVVTTTQPGVCQAVYALAPGLTGGYVLGLGNHGGHSPREDCSRVTKLNASFGIEWRAAETPAGTNCYRDRYLVIQQVADGYVALGNRRCQDTNFSTVLTKFAAGGGVVWSQVNSNGVGNSLVATPDGGWLVVGTSPTRRPDNVPCLWLVKTDPAGQPAWELCLGTETGARGVAGAMAEDGHYIVAGNATLSDGTNCLWVVKVDASQQAPVAAFTVSPASPVFRDQEVTFDASASTAPGNAIAAYEWEFGDGSTATGPIVRHTYRQLGTNTVTLTVVNTNGVLASTSQVVIVVDLALQWERFFGRHASDILYALTEAWDGGFVLTGQDRGRGDANTGDLWLLRTDSRGRPVWDKRYRDAVCTNRSEAGFGVARAPTNSYVVAGRRSCSGTAGDGWLLKVDEAGGIEWFGAYLVPGNNSEQAWCVAPLPDGGYILGGSTITNGGWVPRMYPWLVRTDAEGNELEKWKLDFPGYRAYWVVPLPETGGYVLACGGGDDETDFNQFLVAKVRDDHSVEWSCSTGSEYQVNLARWVVPTADGGFVASGTYSAPSYDLRYRFCLLKADSAGNPVWVKTWPGPSRTMHCRGRGGAVTPDGGFIVVGDHPGGGIREDLAIWVTDSDGQTRWTRLLGAPDVSEGGRQVLALADGSFVILGWNGSSNWLFKLAPNHPPVPQMTFSPSPAPPGQLITFDGTASSDPDGTVVAWEWDFGDGVTTNGPVVQHTYTNAGSFVVRLTVVDDDGAERSLTNRTCAVGITALSAGVTVTLAEITNAPAADPLNYPPSGAPADLDWATAYGFRIGATGPNGNKTFRIAFCEPISTNYLLYRLPAWTNVAYTNINQVAIDVSLPIAGGVLNTNLVLARKIIGCALVRCELAGTNRLRLTFTTKTGNQYRVLRGAQLVPAEWQLVPHARSISDPLTLETLPGSGAPETVYVAIPPDATGFYCIAVESLIP